MNKLIAYVITILLKRYRETEDEWFLDAIEGLAAFALKGSTLPTPVYYLEGKEEAASSTPVDSCNWAAFQYLNQMDSDTTGESSVVDEERKEGDGQKEPSP